MGIGPNPNANTFYLDQMFAWEEGHDWIWGPTGIDPWGGGNGTQYIRLLTSFAQGGPDVELFMFNDSGSGVTVDVDFSGAPTTYLINVHYEDGVSTATDVGAALLGSTDAMTLIDEVDMSGVIPLSGVNNFGWSFRHGTATPLQFQNEGNIYGPLQNPTTITVVFGFGWTGGDIQIVGTDVDDLPQTETFTSAPNTVVSGQKFFKTVTTDSNRSILDGTWNNNSDYVVLLQGPNAILPDVPYAPTWHPYSAGTITSNDLYTIWGNGTADKMWAAGANGTVLFYDALGGGWHVVTTGFGDNDPDWSWFDIYGFADNDVWFVGSQAGFGRAMHWDGASFSLGTITGVNNQPWSGVFGVATDDIWACTRFGKIWHYDGVEWTLNYESFTGEGFFKLWGAATDDIWASGVLGTVRRWDGAAWNLVNITNPNPDQYFTNIWGYSANDIWMCGGGIDGAFAGGIWHWNGSTWNFSFDGTFEGLADEFEGIGGGVFPDNTWATSFNGTLWHWDGTLWEELDSAYPGVTMYETYFSAPNGGWAVGAGGHLQYLFEDVPVPPPQLTFEVSSVVGGNQQVIVNFQGAAGGHILDSNCEAIWRFDEASASDDLVDATGHGHTVLAFGDPPAVTGLIGGARQTTHDQRFQGHGNLSMGTCFNGEWTIEQWINPDHHTASSNTFIYNGLDFSIVNADTILAEIQYDITGIVGGNSGRILVHQWQNPGSATTMTSTRHINSGEWSHIAVSRTAEGGNLWTFKIYINGALDSTHTGIQGLTVSAPGDHHFIGVGNYIGANGFGLITSVGNPFFGRMDDLRVSKVVRSDAEIQDSFFRGSQGGNLALTGDSLNPAKWVISAGDEPHGVPLTVSQVAAGDAEVILTTNEATIGADYILGIPNGIVKGATALSGPLVWHFTGAGVTPFAYLAQVIDTRHVRVIFSESVQPATATNVENWSIDNGLEVLAVAEEGPFTYILTTTEQTPDVLYTVTITNVEDDADNPV